MANLVQEHGRCLRFLHLGEAGNIVRGAQAQQAGGAGGGAEGLLCTGSALCAGGRRARASAATSPPGAGLGCLQPPLEAVSARGLVPGAVPHAPAPCFSPTLPSEGPWDPLLQCLHPEKHLL